MGAIGPLSELLKRDGLIRTDLHCHNCDMKGYPTNFIASIDHRLNGNHQIECPRCGHIHYRVIKDGVVTSDRYDSDQRTHVIERRNVWKAETVPAQTSVASAFIRDLWLNK